jgi:hypothetical protein
MWLTKQEHWKTEISCGQKSPQDAATLEGDRQLAV